MKIKFAPILFALSVIGMLALVVRSFAQGPATKARPRDSAAASRLEPPPKGYTDERQPLPPAGAVGGAGIIEPADREARLAGASAGVIQTITVKDGDHVSAGQVLLELDLALEQAALETAEADLASARANLTRTVNGQRVEDKDAAVADAASARSRSELSDIALARAEQLFKGGAMTQEELDKARLTAASDKQTWRSADARAQAARVGSRVEDIAVARANVLSAETRVAQAKATIERRRLRAPYGGEVLQVKARVGEYYSPGASETPVVLGDTRKLRVRLDVDERDIGRVKLGQPGFALADAFPGVRFAGKVTEIGHRMGRKNVRTDDPVERLDTKILEVVVELDEAAGRLVPGLRVTGYIDVAAAP